MAPTRGLTAAVTLALVHLIAPVAVTAQQPPARLTLGGSAGISNPLHGDFDFTAPAWQISVRTAVSDHFLIEGFFDEWKHTSEDIRQNQQLRDPNGVVGTAGRLTIQTVHRTRSVGFNFLARGAFDRVTLTAGGGPGVWLYQRQYTQTLTDCQASQPEFCRDFANEFSNSVFSIQGVAGLEVAITSRIAAFGQFQFLAPTTDIAGGHSTVSAGVRVRIW